MSDMPVIAKRAAVGVINPGIHLGQVFGGSLSERFLAEAAVLGIGKFGAGLSHGSYYRSTSNLNPSPQQNQHALSPSLGCWPWPRQRGQGEGV